MNLINSSIFLEPFTNSFILPFTFSDSFILPHSAQEEDSESDYDGEEEDEEAAERKRRRKKQQASKKSIYELYEPSELERGFFTDADHEIRTMDSPERFLLRKTKKLAQQEDQEELKDEELAKEAEWIYENAFKAPTVSSQVRDAQD